MTKRTLCIALLVVGLAGCSKKQDETQDKEDADKQRTQAELMQVEILNLVN